MKPLWAYEASDGRLFKTAQEALEYENTGMLLEKIDKFFEVHQVTDQSESAKLIIRWADFTKTNQIDASIETLGLTDRSRNCLRAENINTVSDLIKCRANDLLKTPNLGRKSLNEIVEVLTARGLALSNN